LAFCCCFTKFIWVSSISFIHFSKLSMGASFLLSPCPSECCCLFRTFWLSMMDFNTPASWSKVSRSTRTSFSICCPCPAVCLANFLAVSNLLIIQCFNNVCPFKAVAQCLPFGLEVIHKIGDPRYPSGAGLVEEHLDTDLFQMVEK